MMGRWKALSRGEVREVEGKGGRQREGRREEAVVVGEEEEEEEIEEEEIEEEGIEAEAEEEEEDEGGESRPDYIGGRSGAVQQYYNSDFLVPLPGYFAFILFVGGGEGLCNEKYGVLVLALLFFFLYSHWVASRNEDIISIYGLTL